MKYPQGHKRDSCTHYNIGTKYCNTKDAFIHDDDYCKECCDYEKAWREKNKRDLGDLRPLNIEESCEK